MKDASLILKGQIVYTKRLGEVEICPDSYLVCEEGKVRGVYKDLPDELSHLLVKDYGERLIVPGFCDLHLHAPQYSLRGLGMDLELLEWLETHTFPEEAKYADIEYARRAYTIFVQSLAGGATTRACVFATIHTEGTLLLMDEMEKSGVVSYVGKVNMDRNAPEYLCEPSAQASASETKIWLEEVRNRKYVNTMPILTPRFIPSCTDELFVYLKEIQLEERLPVQSHLSENPSEVEWVKELCSWSNFYGEAYDKFGLFGKNCKTVMAHCVYSEEEEQQCMKDNGVFVAHCPESNINLSSGVAPIRRFLDRGLQVGLGSDVAGGSSANIFSAMSYAVQASKMRWRLEDSELNPLTIDEVFYMATKGGGAFFGQVGSFEEGYEFDAVVLDDKRLQHPKKLGVKERLERMIYLADEREVCAKYVRGVELKNYSICV